jgi:hypothetical protein
MTAYECDANLLTSICIEYYLSITILNVCILKWAVIYSSIYALLNKYNSIFKYKFNDIATYADSVCSTINTVYFITCHDVQFIIGYYLYDMIRMYIQSENDPSLVFHHLVSIIGFGICPTATCHDEIINNGIIIKRNDVILFGKRLIENSPLYSIYPRMCNFAIMVITSTNIYFWLFHRAYFLLVNSIDSYIQKGVQVGLIITSIGYSYIMYKSLIKTYRKLIY